MAIEGVDYDFPPRPSAAGLAAAGKKFAARYGGPGTEDKWLHPDEAQALSAAGISIVCVAEGSTSGLLGGAAVGRDWARRAHDWFIKCGMPAGAPIYLAIDFDVTAAQWPQVADGLRGAAAELGGVGRVGAYGGRRAIEWAMRDGVAKWSWQTYAWSGTPTYWVPGVHVQQYLNGVDLAGGKVDLNRAMTADFGQWMPGGMRADKMMMIAKDQATGKIWLCDGMTRREISGRAVSDLLYLGKQGALSVWQGGPGAPDGIWPNVSDTMGLPVAGEVLVNLSDTQVQELGNRLAGAAKELVTPLASALDAASGVLREAAGPVT